MIENNLYTFKANCYGVVDGDTIDVMIDFGFDIWGDRRLRLLNVDTPERGQENYTEATDFVKDKVLIMMCWYRHRKMTISVVT